MFSVEMMSSDMLGIVAPALVASLMIALTHAPLGIEVLKRGIIFIDLAVAQIAGLGLVVAGEFIHEPSSWMMQGVALAAATLAGLCFHKVEQVMPQQQEAIIGVSFVLAASLALLLLADHPHGGEEIQHLLSGQMLFVTWADVASHAPVYAVIMSLWFGVPAVRSGIGFYLLFALAITSSVQLVGVYVVFASLILPALAVVRSRHSNVKAHIRAWVCGVVSVVLGMGVAMVGDVPAGPVMVVSYVLVALSAAVGSVIARRRKP